MRSIAITLWVILFPGNEGEMTTFGIVQHNFFIFFNAAIGLLFLRRANREIFGGAESESSKRGKATAPIEPISLSRESNHPSSSALPKPH